MRRAALLLVVLALAGCGGGDTKTTGKLLIAVDAPFSRSQYIGQTIARGVELAASEVNVGGVPTPDGNYMLEVKRYDNALSPRKALANIRRAISDGAVAIVDDGTGVDAGWQAANEAHIPIGITYDGGGGLVDLEKRPNVFRIAPTNRGIAFRLAEYTIPKGLKLALIHDDTTYGQQGGASLDEAFSRNPGSVATKLTVPPGTATSRRRFCAPAERARRRCSSGARRPPSRRSSSPRAAPAGTCRSMRRRPPRIRSCGSSSRTGRSGSTV